MLILFVSGTFFNELGIFKLANMRFVNVSEFRGKALVNIREYYEKDGKQLPGKKGEPFFEVDSVTAMILKLNFRCYYIGISLSLDQWENLKKFMKNIDSDVKKFK